MVKIKIFKVYLSQKTNISEDSMGEKISKKIKFEYYHTTNIILKYWPARFCSIYADLYRVNLKNDPHCVCDHLFEDAIHFFLECRLYQHDRIYLTVLMTLFPSL